MNYWTRKSGTRYVQSPVEGDCFIKVHLESKRSLNFFAILQLATLKIRLFYAHKSSVAMLIPQLLYQDIHNATYIPKCLATFIMARYSYLHPH